MFGKYVSIYDFEDAVKDGATVPIIYEPRQISLGESHDFDKVVKEAQTCLMTMNKIRLFVCIEKIARC